MIGGPVHPVPHDLHMPVEVSRIQNTTPRLFLRLLSRARGAGNGRQTMSRASRSLFEECITRSIVHNTKHVQHEPDVAEERQVSPTVGPPSRVRQRAPARAPRISDPARRARHALGKGVGPEGLCGWAVWVGGAMGYEPVCRVFGLEVLPPRVPPSRPARQV